MRIVNQGQLDRANYAVTCELDAHGFYDAHVHAVNTRLVSRSELDGALALSAGGRVTFFAREREHWLSVTE